MSKLLVWAVELEDNGDIQQAIARGALSYPTIHNNSSACSFLVFDSATAFQDIAALSDGSVDLSEYYKYLREKLNETRSSVSPSGGKENTKPDTQTE